MKVFADLNSLIKDTKSDIKRIITAVGKLNKDSKEYRKEIGVILRYLRELVTKINAMITYVESLQEKQLASDASLTNSVNSALEFLYKEVESAIVSSKEFDTPMFSTPLLTVASDPRIITVNVIEGKETDVDVKLNFNEIAGRVEEWSQAIKKAREAIMEGGAGEGSKKRPGSALPEPRASQVWAEKFYGVAREGKSIVRKVKKVTVDLKNKKVNRETDTVDRSEYFREAYWNTMRLRRSFTSSRAPYWEIIDKGNSVKGLDPKDQGGTPYPLIYPANFVRRTIEYTKSFYSREYTKNLAEITRMKKKSIADARKMVTKIEELISRLAGQGREIDYAQAVTEAEKQAIKLEVIGNIKRRKLPEEDFDFLYKKAIEARGISKKQEQSPINRRIEIIKEEIISAVKKEDYNLIDFERVDTLAKKLAQEGAVISKEKYSIGPNLRIRLGRVDRKLREVHLR